ARVLSLSRKGRGIPSPSQPDISLPHAIVAEEVGAAALHHDAAVLQDIAAVGEAQRYRDVLLDEDDRQPVLAQPADDGEDVVDDARREAERGFVEHDEAR